MSEEARELLGKIIDKGYFKITFSSGVEYYEYKSSMAYLFKKQQSMLETCEPVCEKEYLMHLLK